MGKIADLPLTSRPRERALRFGVSLLKDEELLAIIINNGIKGKSSLEIASEILSQYKSINNLSKDSFKNLTKLDGIDEAKAISLLTVFEIHNRIIKNEYGETNIVNNASDIYNLYKYLGNFEQEHLILIILDSRRKILKEITLYKGTSKEMNISVSEIIKEVLVMDGKSFIILHNHVEDHYKPSKNDIFSTAQIKRESARFDITLLDHIIITKSGYFSFKESRKLDAL